MNKKRYFIFFIVVLFFVPTLSHALSDKIYKELSTFSKVIEVIDEYYVKPVDEKAIVHGAIEGMLESLDPHSVYFTASAYKDFDAETTGRFGGVGIEVMMKEGLLTIVTPIVDSPAWQAGIKAGDRILAIDGKPTKGMSFRKAVELMRGSIGKKVSLTIYHQGKARVVTLKRSVINAPGVKVEDLGDGFALFQITSFQDNVAAEFATAVEGFEKKQPIKGMILDLRDNPGGLLPEAVKIADVFLSDDVIVSTRGRNKVLDTFHAHKTGEDKNFPVVVLINGGSASAAEILAAALKDNHRAKILGMNSFGKASVQTVVNLENGDAVKITIAYYYTPHDKLIDGRGIEPDMILDEKAYQKAKNIKEDLENTAETREDFDAFQKQEALAILRKMVE